MKLACILLILGMILKHMVKKGIYPCSNQPRHALIQQSSWYNEANEVGWIRWINKIAHWYDLVSCSENPLSKQKGQSTACLCCLYRSFRGSNQINPFRESVHYISLYSGNCSSLLHSFPLPRDSRTTKLLSPNPKKGIFSGSLWLSSLDHVQKRQFSLPLPNRDTLHDGIYSNSWGIQSSSFPINLPMESAASIVDPSCCCRAHSRQMLTSQHWTSAHRCQHKSNLQGSPIKTREKSPQALHPNHQQIYFILTCAQSLGTKRTTNLFMFSHQIVHFCRAIPGHHPTSPFREISGSQPCSALQAGAASEVGLKQLTTMQLRWWGGRRKWSYDDDLPQQFHVCNLEQW